MPQPPNPRRLVITGMGAVSPIGVTVPRFVRALREGCSGVRRLRFPEAGSRIKSTVTAAVWPDVFDPASVLDAAEVERLPRCVPMALAAAREALERAGLARAANQQSGKAANEGDGQIETGLSRRYGLILGTGAGGIDFTIAQAEQVFAHGGRGSLWTITNATHGNLAGELSIRLGLRGPSWCVSTGCASSTDALGMAMHRLRAEPVDESEDALDGFVVVGADAHVSWTTLAGMEMLRVVSTRSWDHEDPATASRPFDKSRDGFILGEGAWAVVVEREAAVARRSGERTAVADLLGYAATCDAFHRVRPAPDMEESARAMRLAVRDAGLAMTDVGLIHYHGTATKMNDALETSAVKLAFGPPAHAARLRGTSIKGMIGHPQGACGLASLVATLGALTTQGVAPFVPPTINLREPDVEGGCDLDYTALRAAPTNERVALINCLAFGAKNAAVVVRGKSSLLYATPCGRQ